uniref:Uncharacterized protein n=1 Tax=Lactuca sativa TaxID=4236 RepID=A0A9R1UXS5_LACSA|nr:hypothetical protein LSAT_V11C700364030 [Lactuca sativa]
MPRFTRINIPLKDHVGARSNTPTFGIGVGNCLYERLVVTSFDLRRVEAQIGKKLSTIIDDKYYEKHLELKKKLDEIRNDYWGY